MEAKEIIDNLQEIQPEGFDWSNPTESEMVKFKAGQESVPEPWDREQAVYEDGKQAGIREVVEWEHKTFSKSITLNQMQATNTYQSKLKEWGIKEGIK